MSSNPSQIGTLGHRVGVWLRNANLASSGSAGDIWADRVQSADPTATHNIQDYYELGRVSKIGVTADPTEYRFVLEENLHNSEIDMYLAGVNPTSGSGYDATDLVTQSNTGYIVWRNDSDSVFQELAFGSLRQAEIQYRFVSNGACTVQYTLEGTSGSRYTTAGTFVHPLWGAQDTSSPGGIHGKDARIAFTANAAANKTYRLQSFTLRIQYPIQTVRELGSRQLVGKLSDSPNVTCDFDLLPGDEQPDDVFFATSTDGGATHYDFGSPQTVPATFINVYDPTLAEGASVIKSFKLENLRPASNMPSTARVRQLTTARYSLTSTGETTLGTSGVIVSKTEITS